MFKFDLEDFGQPCVSKEQIKSNGWSIVEENDGTVSLLDREGKGLGILLRKPCCELIGYTFDDVNQKCVWCDIDASQDSDEFKIILNPQSNSGAIFNVDENETCCLDVSFDYLFKFDCILYVPYKKYKMRIKHLKIKSI